MGDEEGPDKSSEAAERRDLLRSIAELIQLLETVGEERWAEWLRSDLQRLTTGDAHALRHVLSAFGGMGSLSGLMIHPLNGHGVDEDEAVQLNKRLGQLRGEVHRLTRDCL